MKKFIQIAATLCFLSYTSFSQDNNTSEKYTWEKNTLTNLTDAEKAEPAVILEDSRIYEYKLGYNTLDLEKTVKKTIFINEEKALDEFNKIAIPMSNVKSVVSLYARTIGPDGKSVTMDQSKLKEMTNIEGYGNFKVFAIEGASVGGEIEYEYVLSMIPAMSKTEVYQGDYPVRSGTFELKAPKKFTFETKSYNGFPVVNDIGIKDKWYRAVVNNVPGMPEEQYATYRANLMKVSFALASKNEFLSTTAGLNWERIRTNIFETVHGYKSGDFSKAVKLQKEMNIDDLPLKEKIEAIEDYLKTHFTFNPNASSSLKEVFKTKQGDQLGMVRLYSILFSKYQIPYKLIITSNRYNSKFDPEFPSLSNLDGILFSFFDMEGTYLAPTEVAYRLGMAPFQYTNNDALEIVVSNYQIEPYHHFVYIDHASANDNQINKNVTISLDEDFSAGILDIKNSITGYRAFNSREVLYYASDQIKEDFLKYMSSSGFEEAEVKDEEILNKETSMAINNLPFIYNCTVKTSDLIEKAGQDYIINIGKVIGQQSELYQERERQQPIHMDYPMHYKYEIRLNIPEGYRVESPEDLNIAHMVFEDSIATAQFVSSYDIKDQQLIVLVSEIYQKNTYDLSLYDEFREVINAASDFSKRKVLLTKTKISN